eukprot:EG_transcript_13238
MKRSQSQMKPAADPRAAKGKPAPGRPASVTPAGAATAASHSAGASTFAAPAPLPRRPLAGKPPPSLPSSSFPAPKPRSGSAMPRPTPSQAARSSSVFSQRSSSIAFPKPPARTAQPTFNSRSSLGGESLASLMAMSTPPAGGLDRGRPRPAGGLPLAEDELLEFQLLQWRFVNHRFERAKAEQLQAGLDQLHALLTAAAGAQEHALAAEVERHQQATQQALQETMADVPLGQDQPALERFDRLHAVFLDAVMNSCNTLQTTGIYVSSEAELQRELQRCTRLLQTMADRLRPACEASRNLQQAWQELHTMQGRVLGNLQAAAERLRETEQQEGRQNSTLVVAIQQADLANSAMDTDEIPALLPR